MITHLSIDNFVLVEHLELSFSAGMQVLTGKPAQENLSSWELSS